MTRRSRLVDVTGALDRLAEIASDPTTADRLGAWVDTQEALVPDVQTGIRLPQAFLDRADALVEPLTSDPSLTAMGPASRSGVLRLALGIGLSRLERDPGGALGRSADARVRLASGRVVTVTGDGAAIVEAVALLGGEVVETVLAE